MSFSPHEDPESRGGVPSWYKAEPLDGFDPDSGEWKPVSGLVFGGFSFFFVWMSWLLLTEDAITGESFMLRMLHNVNLVFHEFGHPAFSFFGETLAILGGTLGQLGIPLICAIAFWRQRDSLGFAAGAWWFFENFLDVAVYMADAKYLKLQLIGGLGMEAHDWRNLFLIWDCLLHATTIAAITKTLGWLGMVSIWIWLGTRWLYSR